MAGRNKSRNGKKRVKVNDLPASKKGLRGRDMKKVKAGFSGGVRVGAADLNEDRRNDLIVPGSNTK